MKYIRTRGKIFKVIEEKESEDFIIIKGMFGECRCPKLNILKQADTIEELCDGFVIKWSNGTYCKTIMDSLDQAKYWLKQDNNATIYGAIFTDKGIIFVAKPNEKGELELWRD